MFRVNHTQAFPESAFLATSFVIVAAVVLSNKALCRRLKPPCTKTVLCAEKIFESKHLSEQVHSKKRIKGTLQPCDCHKKTDRAVWAEKREHPEKAHFGRPKKRGYAGVKKTFDEQAKHREALYRHRLEKKTRDNQIKYDRDSKMTLSNSILFNDEENV